MDGSLFERGRTLEDVFFAEKDRLLLDQLRQENSDRENRDALAAASGISNVDVLDSLVENKVTVESLTSVTLIPLIAVAWADGVMEDAERDAILNAAHVAGIEKGSAAFSLLAEWLANRPSASLLNSWKAYIAALKSNLDAAAVELVRDAVMDRAKEVANAAGGILGFGKTSGSESKMLAELEKAFD